ncbi:hypothetical protein AB9P05_21730 [Roseivirga sp. BDSF3-8]|uniref:hypothetical protein n=1 Tax=Roseivirga sp. BDSF3-8 TaxID=3241598 RepID=UPI00353187A6
MKRLLLLPIVLGSLLCQAQDIGLFSAKSPYDWEANGYRHVGEGALEELLRIMPYEIYPDFSSAFEYIDRFHLIDIDKDGVDEVLYNGYTGGEGEGVLIFRKVNGAYQYVSSWTGRVVDLHGEEGTHLVLLDYACCAGYVDHLTYLEYLPGEGRFRITEDYAAMGNSLIDYQSIEPVRFEVIQESYNMRDSPNIKTGLREMDLPYMPIDGQNIVTVYHQGDKGTALAEWEDDTGRVWWLVVMDDTPNRNNSLFYGGNNDYKHYKAIGWMSSRYLRPL